MPFRGRACRRFFASLAGCGFTIAFQSTKCKQQG
nr:MAG TPA: hypothetical protein [Caudoviricetes sp.]